MEAVEVQAHPSGCECAVCQAHGSTCSCAECVPCEHHPGEDCGCYCRFMGCSPRNCGGEFEVELVGVRDARTGEALRVVPGDPPTVVDLRLANVPFTAVFIGSKV